MLAFYLLVTPYCCGRRDRRSVKKKKVKAKAVIVRQAKFTNKIIFFTKLYSSNFFKEENKINFLINLLFCIINSML